MTEPSSKYPPKDRLYLDIPRLSEDEKRKYKHSLNDATSKYIRGSTRTPRRGTGKGKRNAAEAEWEDDLLSHASDASDEYKASSDANSDGWEGDAKSKRGKKTRQLSDDEFGEEEEIFDEFILNEDVTPDSDSDSNCDSDPFEEEDDDDEDDIDQILDIDNTYALHPHIQISLNFDSTKIFTSHGQMCICRCTEPADTPTSTLDYRCSILSRLNLVFQRAIKTVISRTTMEIVPMDDFLRHIYATRFRSRKAESLKQHVCDAFGISPTQSFDDVKRSLSSDTPVDGLNSPNKYWYCPECGAAESHSDKVVNHMQVQHKLTFQTTNIPWSYRQLLFRHPKNMLFHLLPNWSPPPTEVRLKKTPEWDDILSLWPGPLLEAPLGQQYADQLGWKDIRSLLFAQGHSTKDLMYLLELKKLTNDDPLRIAAPALRKFVFQYHQKGWNFLLDRKILQSMILEGTKSKLNDISVATMERQSETVTQCIIAYMRLRRSPIDALRIILSDEQEEYAQNLQAILEAYTEDNALLIDLGNACHNFLACLTMTTASLLRLVETPMDIAIFLQALQRDGSFKPAPRMTSLPSHYQALTRSIACNSIRLKLASQSQYMDAEMAAVGQDDDSGMMILDDKDIQDEVRIYKQFMIFLKPTAAGGTSHSTPYSRMKNQWYRMSRFEEGGHTTVSYDLDKRIYHYFKPSTKNTIDIDPEEYSNLCKKLVKEASLLLVKIFPLELQTQADSRITALINSITDNNSAMSAIHLQSQNFTVIDAEYNTLLHFYSLSPSSYKKKYPSLCQLFLEAWVIAFVCTCGIPPRAPTINDLRYGHLNTEAPRNLHYTEGSYQMSFRLRDKGAKARGSKKPALYPLADTLGKCLLYFLSTFRKISIHRHTSDIEAADDDLIQNLKVFVFCHDSGKRWKSQFINNLVKSYTSSHFNGGVSTRDLRQIALAIVNIEFEDLNSQSVLSSITQPSRSPYAPDFISPIEAQKYRLLGQVWQVRFGVSTPESHWPEWITALATQSASDLVPLAIKEVDRLIAEVYFPDERWASEEKIRERAREHLRSFTFWYGQNVNNLVRSSLNSSIPIVLGELRSFGDDVLIGTLKVLKGGNSIPQSIPLHGPNIDVVAHATFLILDALKQKVGSKDAISMEELRSTLAKVQNENVTCWKRFREHVYGSPRAAVVDDHALTIHSNWDDMFARLEITKST